MENQPFRWAGRIAVYSDGARLTGISLIDQAGGFGDAGGGIRLSDSAAAAIGRLVVDMIARRRSPASVAPERAAPTSADNLRQRYSAQTHPIGRGRGGEAASPDQQARGAAAGLSAHLLGNVRRPASRRRWRIENKREFIVQETSDNPPA